MKRKLLLQALMATLLLAVGVQTARAQRPVGDTLTSMDPSYFPYNYNWFIYDDSMKSSLYCFNLYWFPDSFQGFVNQDFYFEPGDGDYGIAEPLYCIGNMITGNQLYTDRPLKILGIAACGYMQKMTYIPLPGYPGEGEFPNALALYPERFTPNVIDQTIAHRIYKSQNEMYKKSRQFVRGRKRNVHFLSHTQTNTKGVAKWLQRLFYCRLNAV